MDMKTLFEKALSVESPWEIESIEFNADQKRLDIKLGFARGTKFFYKDPDTLQEGYYNLHDTQEKVWRHMNFFEHECYLHAKIPRVKTNEGTVRLTTAPWEGRVAGFTLLFESFLLMLCQHMPVSQVSKLANTTDHKIWSMLDYYVTKAREDLDFSNVTTIGIDETSQAKGHSYITLFVDLHKKKTMFITKGKDHSTLIEFKKDLEEHRGKAGNITDVSCDMSPAFIKGVTNQLPHAQITFDKFHVIKVLNEAVDQVRREEAKTNPLLKGCRYVFLKNDHNLTEKQKADKEILKMETLNLKSMKALQIRETFQQIYHANSLDTFIMLLNKWYYWAIECLLPPIQKALQTIKNHWQGIVQWKLSQINNGILEGLNSVIQAAKRKARGYKFKHFKTIAYLITANLNFSKINVHLNSTQNL